LCHSQVAELVDAKKEINFVSKWKHMMVH
jgi:hypothetical protein